MSEDNSLNSDKLSDRKNFTVIITSYNLGRYIEEAIDSVHNQTLGNIQLIVVDDCSDDPDTIRILDKISDSVHLIRLNKNKGLPAARNEGIKSSNSEYICCLDADDHIESTYLEKAKNIFESYKDVGIVSSYVLIYGDIMGTWKCEEDKTDLASFLTDNRTHGTSCFRREASVKVGMYDEKMRSHEDWEHWIKIIKDGWKVKVIPECLMNYRKRKDSMLAVGKSKTGIYYSQIINKHKELYEDHFVEILSAKHLEVSKKRSELNQLRSLRSVRIALWVLKKYERLLSIFVKR